MTTLHNTDIDTHNADMTAEIAQLRHHLRMCQRRLEATHQITVALGAGHDLDTLLRETLVTSLNTVDADAGSLLLYNTERKRLVFKHVVGNTSLIGQEIDPVTDISGRASTVFRTGKSLVSESVDPAGYNPQFDTNTGYQTRSILTVPLRDLQGNPIGVMQAINKKTGHFDHEDTELLEIIGGLSSTVIVNAQLAIEAQLAAVARAVGDLGHDIKNALTPIETLMDTTVDSFIQPMFDDLDTIANNCRDRSADVADEIENAILPLRDWCPEARTSVKDGCADIREMVSEIADYIKGTQSTHMVMNDLSEVLQDRLRRLKVVAQSRRVEITLEGMETVPRFMFDQRLVGRAIFNLINNSLGAISDGVKRGVIQLRQFHVVVRAEAVQTGQFPDGGYCMLEVKDDGPGMPHNVRDSLFTMAAISTTVGGTGIGTRFVKSVADAHGGLVGVKSEPGEGAMFWMKLPLKTE